MRKQRYEPKPVMLDGMRVRTGDQGIVMGGRHGDTDREADDEFGQCEGPLRRRERGDAGVKTRQREEL